MHNGPGLHNFSAPTILRRIRPEHNERRFYALAVTADLFGNIVLMRNWGRIGTEGKQRGDLHPDYTSAATTLERLAIRKRRRGYLDWDLCAASALLLQTHELTARPIFRPPGAGQHIHDTRGSNFRHGDRPEDPPDQAWVMP